MKDPTQDSCVLFAGTEYSSNAASTTLVKTIFQRKQSFWPGESRCLGISWFSEAESPWTRSRCPSCLQICHFCTGCYSLTHSAASPWSCLEVERFQAKPAHSQKDSIIMLICMPVHKLTPPIWQAGCVEIKKNSARLGGWYSFADMKRRSAGFVFYVLLFLCDVKSKEARRVGNSCVGWCLKMPQKQWNIAFGLAERVLQEEIFFALLYSVQSCLQHGNHTSDLQGDFLPPHEKSRKRIGPIRWDLLLSCPIPKLSFVIRGLFLQAGKWITRNHFGTHNLCAVGSFLVFARGIQCKREVTAESAGFNSIFLSLEFLSGSDSMSRYSSRIITRRNVASGVI